MTLELGIALLITILIVVVIIVLPAYAESTPSPPLPPPPMTTREWIELLLAQQQPPPPHLPPSPTIPGIRDRIQTVSDELANTRVQLNSSAYQDAAYTEIDTPDEWSEDTIPEIFAPSLTRVGH